MSSGGAVAAVFLSCVGFGVGVWYYRDHPEALAAFVTAFFNAFNNQDRSRSSSAKENGSELPNEGTVSPEVEDSTARTGAPLEGDESDRHTGDNAMDSPEAEDSEHVPGCDGLRGEELPV
jgi:hypothetical protein